MTPRLTLYSKPDCCLCDQAEARIRKLARELPLELEIVDITGDPALEAAWGTKIPVVALDGEVVLISRISEFWLRRVLAGERSERLTAL